MKIPSVKSLSVITVNVPLKRPIVASLGTFEYWPYMLIEITLSDGTIGKGYIGPYLVNYTQTIALAMKELFKNFQNREIAPYQFYNEGMNHLSLLGRSGIALYALAGLDIAFWDASSKICSEPLCVHLGGSVDKVKAYNSSGLWLDDPQILYDETVSLVDEGNFEAVKIRLGRKILDEDLKAIENVKKGIGVNSDLLCDFNQCLSLPQAIHRLNDLDEQGLYWFEEPIKYYAFEGYKELRKRMKTPIILGENFHGFDDAFTALKNQISDFIMPDLLRIGGVSAWLKTASIAEGFQISVSSHLYHEVSSHLMRVTPTAGYLEWTRWSDIILEEPYELSDGHVVIPNKIGTGIDFNKETIKKYEYKY